MTGQEHLEAAFEFLSDSQTVIVASALLDTLGQREALARAAQLASLASAHFAAAAAMGVSTNTAYRLGQR